MKNHKKFTIALGALILCTSIFVALELTGKTHFFRDSSGLGKDTALTAKTTSTEPSAQSDFSAGDSDKQPGNTQNESRGTALVKDTGNTNVGTANTAITSDTGEITVYSPSKNGIIAGGAVLSGKSTLPKVEYRIIDSISGVIATGSLVVKDGVFSGKISFDTNAADGRIDIFATRADLSEYSTVEIPIKFKN